MRIDAAVTAVSWIPREAVEGLARMTFETGFAHYDLPPPDRLEDLSTLLADDRIRFANELRAWIEVKDGTVIEHGQTGRGHMGRTTVRLGWLGISRQGVALPDLRPEPQVTATSARFVQTAGGRTAFAAPRRVRGRPFGQLAAPMAWSTLALTIHTDGSSEHELLGASPFPRHWVYDHAGELVGKSGLIDFDRWYREAFGLHTPWGAQDSPAVVSAVESALEHALSRIIIDADPPFRKLPQGAVLVRRGDPGDEVFLLFDGVLEVEVDGVVITELGPGAIVGEMASLHGGQRTATLRAATPCRVAVVPPGRLDPDTLAELAASRDAPDSPEGSSGIGTPTPRESQ
jgi:Cyclic nucleotide-binding domain